MSSAAPPEARATAGFTLIEVLVALAVLASSLAAIGALVASNARASRSLDHRVALMETARAVETGIPGRAALVPGQSEGEISGHRWQMDVRPLAVEGVPANPHWVPQAVTIRVRAPSGATLTLETIRIARADAKGTAQ
ncbi:prepilin-type N-terminal cleavage/methylation domain-containing protein [Xanthobacter autotrophicus DSM 431]|uniref:type II secretion system protein J n=1 Tax=Xanthobacter nonsaccharivorans TaxID=3119912 RepID=UPI003729A625